MYGTHNKDCHMTVLEKCHHSVYEAGRGRTGGKIEWKSSEDNTRAVSRQNKLIGKFKMAAGHVMCTIRG